MKRHKTTLSLEETDAVEVPNAGHEQSETAESAEGSLEAGMEEDAIWSDAEEIAPSSRDRLITLAAIFLGFGWTGFYLWARAETLLANSLPSLWASSVFEWIVPILLIIITWQLAMRTGRAEQGRFIDASAMLAQESSALETRLTAVNRELSIARDFIASQSRDLEALGRMAVERLSTNADKLQGLISENSNRIEEIGSVSTTALANLDQLREQLPVVANSARDMSNQVGNAGNIAQRQFEELSQSLEKVKEFGEAGETHVERVNVLVSEALDAFDQNATKIGKEALGTFEMLNQQSDIFRRQLYERDQQAIADIKERADGLIGFIESRNERLLTIEESSMLGMRQRIETLVSESDKLLSQMVERRNEATAGVEESIKQLEERLTTAVNRVAEIDQLAMENARKRLTELAGEASRLDASMAQSSAAFDNDLVRRQENAREREAEALAALEERLSAFDERLGERHKSQNEHLVTLGEREAELAGRFAAIDENIGQLGGKFSAASAEIELASNGLEERLASSQTALDQNNSAIARLTDESVRMLEILRSSAQHADGELTGSINRVQEQIASFTSDTEEMRALIMQAEEHGAGLAQHISTTRSTSDETMNLLGALEEKLASVTQNSATLAGQTREELQRSIDMLTMTSANVLQDLRQGQSDAVREIAEKIAAQSNKAIADALSMEAEATISKLEQAAERAGQAGRETTMHLHEQMSKVNELVGNLEQRVTTARERAEEEIDHDFTRSMALITDALNSSAIDISKAFEQEVDDTQWASYMRGDRGVFTRRAVRLIDKQDVRAIHDVYDEDAEFREITNRYIHDFEAMLRTVLSTRDGNAIAVTLLSSDIGKLYVALAQAIERLRD